MSLKENHVIKIVLLQLYSVEHSQRDDNLQTADHDAIDIELSQQDTRVINIKLSLQGQADGMINEIT